MTTPKLYTATVRGKSVLGTWEVNEGDFCNLDTPQFRVFGDYGLPKKYFDSDEVSDLTEVTVVPKDAVVIDVGHGIYRTSPKWYARNLRRIVNCAGVRDVVGETVSNAINELADQFAQLNPSAFVPKPDCICPFGGDQVPNCPRCFPPSATMEEPHYHSLDEMKEGGVKQCDCGEPMEGYHTGDCSVFSTPTVTIELTEHFWECRCTLGDPHFHQDSPKSTPPRMEEPKEFGAMVKATASSVPERKKWIRDGRGYWRCENGIWTHDWSDLINPTRVEEKE